MRQPTGARTPPATLSEPHSADAASDILMELSGNVTPPVSPTTKRQPVVLSASEDNAALPPLLAPPSLRNRLLPNGAQPGVKDRACHRSVEAVAIARHGGVMIVGWIDDLDCPVEAITVSCGSWRVTFDGSSLARLRRPDVESALKTGAPHHFGFFGLVASTVLPDAGGTASIDIHLADGGVHHLDEPTRLISPAELRDLALGYLASAAFFGNAQAEGAACLDGGLGTQMMALNRAITGQIVAARYIERLYTRRRQPVGSIIICLYGKADFLFVQNALFAGLPGIEDYEFIFVSNSPEIGEDILREAKLCQSIYGLNQTILLLPGNAGFGAANNAGAAAALSGRIMNVNPDVFPRQKDWAARHTALVEGVPAAQTQLFGVPLYYDDGSLMHGGMYFEMDSNVIVHPTEIRKRRMARVEHYGKGAPPWATAHVRPRAVPAVTGAFMSSNRAWYEQLGGFTEDYIFGHYEDADLCLKSLSAGHAVWLHDLRLWHLEGKGSTRRPHHEGGSLVNRWHFTRSWEKTIAGGLLGPQPKHPALRQVAGEDTRADSAAPRNAGPRAEAAA